jgi:predicted transcriptional regulator
LGLYVSKVIEPKGALMKKIKNEAELVTEALRVGAIYAKKRGVGEFEATDSAKNKITYLYRLLVNDKLVQPLAKGQESEPAMKHKLALWISRQLPEDHHLLK